MIIYATFVNFTYATDTPELIHAWDEYARDANPEGYEQSLKEDLATYSTDVLSKVTVQILVPERVILDALNPTVVVEGVIEPPC